MKRSAERQQRQAGAVSLLLCLVIPLALQLFVAGYRAAGQRRCEVQLGRASAAQLDAVLAGFDRRLWRDFGLWGYDTAQLGQTRVFNQLTRTLPGAAASLTAGAALFTEGELASQIARQMQWRLPASLANQLLLRLDIFRGAPGSSQALSEQLQTVHRSLKPVNPSELLRQTLADDAVGKELAEQARGTLDSLYREVLTGLMPVHISGLNHGQAVEPDFFDPQQIDRLLRALGAVMTTPAPALLDQLYISEYVQAYFPGRVTTLLTDQGAQPCLTPDGRELSEIAKSCPAAVEQIATGLGTAGGAQRAVAGLILFLRTVVHLIDQHQNPAAMAAFRAKAAAVSLGVLILSAGTVMIPQDAIVYLFLLAAAVTRAQRDWRLLKAGRAVSFWPRDPQRLTRVWYPDYLRLLLLLTPRRLLLQRIGKQIQAQVPGQFATSVRIVSAWQSQRLELAKRYSLTGRVQP